MSILIAIIVLGLLIFIHELGHFLLAKLFGVRVETFSIGFGPKLFSIRKGETEYAISAIPFGGYVKMAGDEPTNIKGESYEFLSKPTWQRILIVLAGPLFNVVLGFLAFFLMYYFYGISNIVSPVVYRSETDVLKPGDRILLVDGEEFRGWYFLSRKERAELTILRNGDTLKVVLSSEDVSKVEPLIPPVVGKVIPGSPASRYGLQAGDSVVSINGRKISSWQEMARIIEENPDRKITLTISRKGKLITIEAVPEGSSFDEKGRKVGKLGIVAQGSNVRLSLAESVKLAFQSTLNASVLIFTSLYKLVTGEVSVKSVGGPVMIGKVIGESANAGMSMLLFITGVISINLAVINLIPFPGLDGSHILIFLIEGIVRRRINPKFYFAIQVFGIVVLLGLAVAITVFDIWRIFNF